MKLCTRAAREGVVLLLGGLGLFGAVGCAKATSVHGDEGSAELEGVDAGDSEGEAQSESREDSAEPSPPSAEPGTEGQPVQSSGTAAESTASPGASTPGVIATGVSSMATASSTSSDAAPSGAGGVGPSPTVGDGQTEAEGGSTSMPLGYDGGAASTSQDETTATEDPADAGAPSSDDAEIPVGYVKAIIGVGYGGLRIVSRDGGLTWGDRSFAAPDGGDDEDLLRAVAYGKGRWIATGWKLMISDDGVQWEDLGMLNDGIFEGNPIIEGLTYHDGYFYAAGDGDPNSQLYRSSDGVEWSRYGEGGDTVKHTGLTYRDGLFVSYGDSETSYQSSDGFEWTQLDGLASATYCEGEFKSLTECQDAAWFDDGFYLFPEWGGEIRRSTNGQDWESVYQDDQQNTLYRQRAVAEGYVIGD